MVKATKLSLEEKQASEVFESASYLRVFDALHVNIQNNTPIIVLTGESRTGKTLIARKILRNLIAENFRVFFQDPRITVGEMFSLTCGQIGVEPPDLKAVLDTEKKSEIFFNYLEEKSQEKGPIRFFIDDAQDINTDTLRSILKFMQFQPENKPVLQLILVGLPRLKTVLTSLKLPELDNANAVHLHLDPLDTDEIGSFVAHHLKTSNIQLDDFLSTEGIEKIELYTQRIPGLVGMLVDSAMAVMNLNGDSHLTATNIDEAVDFFSLPWALENKRIQTEQLAEEQAKGNSDQSPQVSFSEDSAMESKTLLSKISTALAGLFSHKKIDNKDSAADHKPYEITQQNTEQTSLAVDEEPRFPDPAAGEGQSGNENNAKTVDLIKTQGIQTTQENTDTAYLIALKHNEQIDTMNEREETMNRAELLNKELKALQNGSPDVEAVALISEDGLVVASALPQDLDEIRVGGMSATLLSLGTRSSAELRRGNVEEIIVRGEEGYTVMLKAGQGTLLLVVANQNAKLGLIFFDMRETIGKLAKIL